MLTKTLKNKWIKALTGGKYKQTKGSLRRGNSYCCLGVFCDIVKGKSKWNRFIGTSYSLMDQEGILPATITSKYFPNNSNTVFLKKETISKMKNKALSKRIVRYCSSDTVTLAGLNDRGFTFKEIAEVIKDCL